MRKLLVVILALLLFPSAALAHRVHFNAGQAASYGYDLGPQTQTSAQTYGRTVNTGVRYTEANDEGDCANNVNPVPFLQARNANVMRFGVQPNFLPTKEGLQCIQEARAAGKKIYLTIAFNSAAPASQVSSYVAQVIQTYGPAWAISLGNEQSLSNSWVPNVSETADGYAAMWQAVEPTIKADDPGAIRVVADGSPWDAGWIERAVSDGLQGAQAVAFHCYNSYSGGLQVVPQLAASLASSGLPLWCSEMAPQTITPAGPLAGAFVTQTVPQYNASVSAAVSQSPNLQMLSWYEWPNIGATTPGVPQ